MVAMGERAALFRGAATCLRNVANPPSTPPLPVTDMMRNMKDQSEDPPSAIKLAAGQTVSIGTQNAGQIREANRPWPYLLP